MAEIIFLKLQNGNLIKIEGHNAIPWFVTQELQKHEGSPSARNIYNKIGLLEPNPRVRDMIMARLLLTPIGEQFFMVLELMPDQMFAVLVRSLKDHLVYLLFPMTPNFDCAAESIFGLGLGFGGALLRALYHVPKGHSTYWSKDLGDVV